MLSGSQGFEGVHAKPQSANGKPRRQKIIWSLVGHMCLHRSFNLGMVQNASQAGELSDHALH